MTKLPAVTAGFLLVLLVAASPPAVRTRPSNRDPGIHGFHSESLARQRRIERALLRGPDPERLQRDARILTEEPHFSGTPENEEVARYIADEFRKAGLEVEMKNYSVYMGFVDEALLELVGPGPRVVLSNPEDGFEEDVDSNDPRAALNWNAYSPSCDLTAGVVYVNHAQPGDDAGTRAQAHALTDAFRARTTTINRAAAALVDPSVVDAPR